MANKNKNTENNEITKNEKNKKMNVAPSMSFFEKTLVNRVKSIEDIPEKNRIDMIKSVLSLPCIPVSFQNLKENNPEICKYVDFSKIKQGEADKKYAFSPEELIHIALHDPSMLTKTLHELNVKAQRRRCYEAYVLYPDDPEYDFTRETCKQEYIDVEALNDDKKNISENISQESSEEYAEDKQ